MQMQRSQSMNMCRACNLSIPMIFQMEQPQFFQKKFMNIRLECLWTAALVDCLRLRAIVR